MNEKLFFEKDQKLTVLFAAAIVIGIIIGIVSTAFTVYTFGMFDPSYSSYNKNVCEVYLEELTIQTENGHEITVQEGKTLVYLCVEDRVSARFVTSYIDLVEAYRNSQNTPEDEQ